MHHIYDTNDNNRLISKASVLPERLRAGLESVWLEGAGAWNPATLGLDPIPVRRRVTKSDFGALFTDSELSAMFSVDDSDVSVFLRRLEYFGQADLAAESSVAFFDSLVRAAVLTAERAAEIRG